MPKAKPKEKRLHFAGYDFTSGPEGTIVHRSTSELPGFQPGDRVEYRDVNLWQQGTVTGADGKWIMVRWDGKSFVAREWAPNLRHASTTGSNARHHATKKSSGIRAVGGPYTVYYEKAGGEPVKTSAATKRQAVLLACATSKMTGGYVTVNHKGIEVAACFGGEVVDSQRHHAAKRSPAQLQREIDEVLAKPMTASRDLSVLPPSVRVARAGLESMHEHGIKNLRYGLYRHAGDRMYQWGNFTGTPEQVITAVVPNDRNTASQEALIRALKWKR